MKHIKGFDTLRAVSIILVLLTHLGLYNFLPESSFIKQRVWLLMSGTTGVQVFFTLSGFLITKILLNELNRFKSINFFNFYVRRFIRLLPPLILFYIAIAVLMSLRMIHTTSYGFLYSFFYLYNFAPNRYYTSELTHTWSLALEEQYYLIWPFVINFLGKAKVVVFILAILFCCVLAVFILPDLEVANGFRVNRWFIPAVAPIIIGSFSALLINNQDEKYVVLCKNKVSIIILGIVLFLSPLYSPVIELSFIFQSVGISVILVWILYNQHSKLTYVLDNRIFSYIGKISYGLYVYQGLFLRTGPGGDLWIQKFPQNIILTFLVAILSFQFFEKPILNLKKKFSRSNN